MKTTRSLRYFWFVLIIPSLGLTPFANQAKAQYAHDDLGHNYYLSYLMHFPDPQRFMRFALVDVSSYIVDNRTTRGYYLDSLFDHSQTFKILCFENDIYWGWTLEGQLADGADVAVAFNNVNTDYGHLYFGKQNPSANLLKPAGWKRSAKPAPPLWQGVPSTNLLLSADQRISSVLFTLHDSWGISYYITDVATDPDHNNVQYFIVYPLYRGKMSKGLLIYDSAYAALKLTIFENDYFGSYTMEGHWNGDGSGVAVTTSASCAYITYLYGGPAANLSETETVMNPLCK